MSYKAIYTFTSNTSKMLMRWVPESGTMQILNLIKSTS